MNDLEFLYQGLFDDGLYSKSFEEFKTQMQDPMYRRRLHEGLSNPSAGEEKLFSGDFATFERKYTPLDYDPNVASSQTFGTDDATMTVERPSAGAIDFVEDATDYTKIRPVGEAEIRTEEAEIVPELQAMYGHLGFEFSEYGDVRTKKPGEKYAPSYFDVPGDYVKVKHKDDPGNGIVIATDQLTSIGNKRIKNKINTYLTEWSKYATDEDIKKTYEHHERVGEIIKIRDRKLTAEEENDIDQRVTKDLERTGIGAKISDFFKGASMMEGARYEVGGSLSSLMMSKLYDFVSTSVDPNSEVVTQAAKYWELEKQKDPDLIVTQEMMEQKVKEFKIKEERNNTVVLETNKYLSDKDWELHKYYEMVADEKLKSINTQIKANDKNIQKIKVLEDTYTMDIQEYNALYENILDQVANGEEVTQFAVDMLDSANLALREKEIL